MFGEAAKKISFLMAVPLIKGVKAVPMRKKTFL